MLQNFSHKILEGLGIARTEYGTTWCGHQWLEALDSIDYENRILRGKTYANTGRVLSFKLDEEKRLIKARVERNYDPYYRVKISLPPITKNQIRSLIKRISRSPLVLAKLSNRQLDPEVLSICESLDIRLFPKSWKDLDASCSCPDYAVPCKHISAVIYIMSGEIDANLFVLFSLRGIDLIKELEKFGVSIRRAKKAEMPSRESILNKQNYLASDDPLPSFDVSTPEGRADWLKNLSELNFVRVPFDPDSILKVLSEKPAGYIQGDLRALTGKVLSRASKLAKAQINNISERTAPEFHGEHEMICINSWGQTRVNPEVSWKEFELPSGDLKNRSVGQKRPDGSEIFYHEIFSGYMNSKRLSSSPEAIEALYDAWMIAAFHFRR